MSLEKIDFCIPYYNRSDLIEETLSAIHNDVRVNKIVITDDASEFKDYDKLIEISSKYKKVVVFRNDMNMGMFLNKRQSVDNATYVSTCEYIVLADSDNVFGPDYLDAIYGLKWDKETIFAPSFAKPNFDYREIAGSYSPYSLQKHFENKLFACSLNTCNYFVNRQEYLKIHSQIPEPYKFGGADSIYFMYHWFKAKNWLFIVPGMEYFHRVHEKSTYSLELEKNLQLSEAVLEIMKKELSYGIN